MAYEGTSYGPILSSGGGGHTVEDAGTPLTARTGLNFSGLLKAADDSGSDETDVTADVASLSALSALDTSADKIPIWDDSASAWKHVVPGELSGDWCDEEERALRTILGMTATKATAYKIRPADRTGSSAFSTSTTSGVQWKLVYTGTGTWAYVLDSDGSPCIDQRTGATNAATADDEHSFDVMLGYGASDRWGFSWRFKVSTAVDSQTTAWFGSLNNQGARTTAVWGGISPALASNFAMTCNAAGTVTTRDTGIPFDTNWHTIRVWWNGTQISWTFDGASVTAVTTNLPAAAHGPRTSVRNGTTNADRRARWSGGVYVVGRA